MLLVIFSVAVGFCFAFVPFLIIEFDKIIEIVFLRVSFSFFNIHLIMSFRFLSSFNVILRRSYVKWVA